MAVEYFIHLEIQIEVNKASFWNIVEEVCVIFGIICLKF